MKIGKISTSKNDDGSFSIEALKHWNFIVFMGQGVAQDYVTAHMWGNIAAANRNANGASLRDEFLVPKMTPDQIAEAQRRARVCMASNYQDCD